MISERVTRSTPQPNMDTQALPPPIAQPQSEALANNNVATGYVKVFKAKSGYVKGLGMRPSSSVRRTIVGSENNNEYVTHLEKKVGEQVEIIQEQGEKIQMQKELKQSRRN
ncbi:hypothetical protein C3L33_04576, partial [Rhododendron williamsianum]